MAPEVSVVILSCNHWDRTSRLLQTLTTTLGVDFETILVDNGSTRDVVAALTKWERSEDGRHLGIRCLFNNTNRGIASGRNQGASQAGSSWLLFLDNDTEVISQDWLAELLEVGRSFPMTGVVGAMLLNVDGSIQFAGGSVNNTGRSIFWTEPREEGTMYALGACLLTPRSVWNQLGGFDTQFDPMDYEDIDYCLRAAEIGRPSVIATKSRLLHHGHVTTGHQPELARMRNFIINGRRFLRRWGERLPGEID